MIYNDPIWVDPRQAGQEMLERSDMICPNRTRFMKERAIYEEAYLPHVADDTQFAFYSCDGPVHDLDPYTYHRLQAWDAFRYGATWQGFWAFSDNGGGTSWNEYATPGRNYAPQFLSPEGVTTAKHMEAIREGLYDYEYLVLLRDAVAAAEAAGRNDAAVQRAKALVTDAPLRVLAGPGADQIRWYTAKDRTVADQVRREVIEALEALG